MPSSKGNLKKYVIGILLLFIISFTALLIISKGLSNLIDEIKSINPMNFLLSISMIYLGEVVRAIRLKELVKSSGKDIGIGPSTFSRLLGRFAATITPGGFGGSPTRASVIGSYSSSEIGEALGIALLETFADTIWPAVFLIIISLTRIRSWIVTAIALFVVVMWLSGTIIVSSYRITKRIYRRLNLSKGLLCRIERQRSLFVNALKKIGNLRLLLTITLLTIASHMIEAYGILILEGLWNPFYLSNFIYFLKAMAAVEASYILVSVPTPGGSGGVEYGFYLYIGSSLAVKWRIVQLSASLLPGLFLAILAPRLLYYIKETSFPEVSECKEV